MGEVTHLVDSRRTIRALRVLPVSADFLLRRELGSSTGWRPKYVVSRGQVRRIGLRRQTCMGEVTHLVDSRRTIRALRVLPVSADFLLCRELASSSEWRPKYVVLQVQVRRRIGASNLRLVSSSTRFPRVVDLRRSGCEASMERLCGIEPAVDDLLGADSRLASSTGGDGSTLCRGDRLASSLGGSLHPRKPSF